MASSSMAINAGYVYRRIKGIVLEGQPVLWGLGSVARRISFKVRKQAEVNINIDFTSNNMGDGQLIGKIICRHMLSQGINLLMVKVTKEEGSQEKRGIPEHILVSAIQNTLRELALNGAHNLPKTLEYSELLSDASLMIQISAIADISDEGNGKIGLAFRYRIS